MIFIFQNHGHGTKEKQDEDGNGGHGIEKKQDEDGNGVVRNQFINGDMNERLRDETDEKPRNEDLPGIGGGEGQVLTVSNDKDSSSQVTPERFTSTIHIHTGLIPSPNPPLENAHENIPLRVLTTVRDLPFINEVYV